MILSAGYDKSMGYQARHLITFTTVASDFAGHFGELTAVFARIEREMSTFALCCLFFDSIYFTLNAVSPNSSQRRITHVE